MNTSRAHEIVGVGHLLYQLDPIEAASLLSIHMILRSDGRYAVRGRRVTLCLCGLAQGAWTIGSAGTQSGQSIFRRTEVRFRRTWRLFGMHGLDKHIRAYLEMRTLTSGPKQV